MTYGQDESLSRRWARRLVSLTLVAVAWGAALLSLVLLPLVALADLLRQSRLAWTRAQLALICFLTCEVLGLGAAAGVWLARPLVSSERWLALNGRLQKIWVRALFGALCFLYGIVLRVEGRAAAEAEGPLVVFSRHTSLVDALLPALILEGWRLRHVLKRELLWDPCLDVVGQRIPNAFVRRGAENSAAEVARVAALGQGLGARDAAVIFPEGTRFTAAKRAQVLAHLARRGDPQALAEAEGLAHLLPPRSGGAHALLAACPEAKALVLTHSGLEGAQTLASLSRGALIGRTLHVRLELVSSGQIPRPLASFEPWLLEVWRDMDRWIAARVAGVAPLRAVVA